MRRLLAMAQKDPHQQVKIMRRFIDWWRDVRSRGNPLVVGQADLDIPDFDFDPEELGPLPVPPAPTRVDDFMSAEELREFIATSLPKRVGRTRRRRRTDWPATIRHNGGLLLFMAAVAAASYWFWTFVWTKGTMHW